MAGPSKSTSSSGASGSKSGAASSEYWLEGHVQQNAKFYETGLLLPGKHARLVEDAYRIAEQVGIAVEDLWTSAADAFVAEERAYFLNIRKMRTDGLRGLCYVGRPGKPDVARRMVLAAALLTRNFITARVRYAEELVGLQMEGTVPNCDVLFVPDFASSRSEVNEMRARMLGTVLMRRASMGYQTVIAAADPKAVRVKYGDAVADLVSNRYVIVQGHQ